MPAYLQHIPIQQLGCYKLRISYQASGSYVEKEKFEDITHLRDKQERRTERDRIYVLSGNAVKKRSIIDHSIMLLRDRTVTPCC
jgi:hypothetical protein